MKTEEGKTKECGEGYKKGGTRRGKERRVKRKDERGEIEERMKKGRKGEQ